MYLHWLPIVSKSFLSDSRNLKIHNGAFLGLLNKMIITRLIACMLVHQTRTQGNELAEIKETTHIKECRYYGKYRINIKYPTYHV